MSRLPTTDNSLIGTLSPATRRMLVASASRVVLYPGEVLMRSGEPIEHLVFPETAPVMLSVSTGGLDQDVGLIGNDGVIGWSRLLGDSPASFGAIACLQSGTAVTIPATAMVEAAIQDPRVIAALLGFAQRFTMQMARTLGATLRDGPDRRIARLLLMIDDRTSGEAITITHASIASTLNLRRATVTDCLHVLEGERMLRCSRGRIAIRDRKALETCAGLAYVAADGLAPFG